MRRFGVSDLKIEGSQGEGRDDRFIKDERLRLEEER